jgi:hypothetical protein
MYAMNSQQQVAEEHYKDLLTEAEIERLVRSEHRDSPVRPRFYGLGQRLVIWGMRLQGADDPQNRARPFLQD